MLIILDDPQHWNTNRGKIGIETSYSILLVQQKRGETGTLSQLLKPVLYTGQYQLNPDMLHHGKISLNHHEPWYKKNRDDTGIKTVVRPIDIKWVILV